MYKSFWDALLALTVFGFLLGSEMANANSLSFVNIYWERDGGSWDTDVSDPMPDSGALNNSHDLSQRTANLTIDMIDGLTHSIISSQYFDGGMTSYGQTIGSFLGSAMITDCGSPTQTLNGAIAALPSFISCVAKQYPQYNQENIKWNILLPPWVGFADYKTDWCQSNNPPAAGFNGNQGNIYYTFVPVSFGCGNYIIGSLTGILSHEMFEASSGNAYACDACENHDFDFMESNIDGIPGLSRCNPSGSSACVPEDSFFPSKPLALATCVCGSGQEMIIQVLADAGQLKNIPWDLDAGAGYLSSLYVGVTISVDAGAWNGGFSHFGGVPISPVETGPITWESAGSGGGQFFQINGFNIAQYGKQAAGQSFNAIVQPNSSLMVTIYDPMWGEPLDAGGLTTEPPYRILPPKIASAAWSDRIFPQGGPNSDSFPVFAYSPITFFGGQVLGRSDCGLPNRSVTDGGLPIEGQLVTCTDPTGIVSTSTTTEAGTYSFTQGFLSSVQVNCVVGGLPDASFNVSVFPSITNISPAIGPTTGVPALDVSIEGFGFTDPSTVNVGVPPNRKTYSVHPIVQGQDISLHLFPSPTGLAGTQPVSVSTSAGLESNSVSFTFYQAGVPYVELSPAPTSQQCTGGLAEVAVIFEGNAADQYSPNCPGFWQGTTESDMTVGGKPGGTWVAGNPNSAATAPTIKGKPGDHLTITDDAGYRGEFALADFWCFQVPHPPLLWHPLAFVPFSDEVYSLVKNIWINPPCIDPFSGDLASVISLTSSIPASDFNIAELGLGSWITLPTTVSSQYSMQVFPYSAPSGSNLCFPGSNIGITLKNSVTPSWDVLVSFPLDPSVPTTSYRVFGLNSYYNAWVEMSSSVVSGALQAHLLSYDPTGITPGVVSGPYALAFYSNSACPTYP